MDPSMMNDGGGVYSDFAEIWQGFQMNANATTSYIGLDPMVIDHRPNQHSAPNQNSRNRRDEDEQCARGGASTGNSNGGNYHLKNDNGGDCKRMKRVGLNENQENQVEEEGNSSKAMEQSAKAEPPKQDYIHVRARRGQATDSHSLAERARRERISERMKILQDLVPGCNKVIGKALVLDEIINYVQSLQHQVEFLSMKLEAVNTRGAIEGCHSKDETLEAPGTAFGSHILHENGQRLSPEWLHMQIGGHFERTS